MAFHISHYDIPHFVIVKKNNTEPSQEIFYNYVIKSKPIPFLTYNLKTPKTHLIRTILPSKLAPKNVHHLLYKTLNVHHPL